MRALGVMKLSELQAVIEGKNLVWSYDGHTIAADQVLLENSITDEDTVWYVAGFEFGPSWLIAVPAYRGSDGFESAWEAWVDAMPTIPESELIEAYGPDSGEHRGTSFYDLAFDEARENAPRCFTPEWDAYHAAIRATAERMLKEYGSEGQQYPDLIEGYEHQSNASGTGIVSMGHYASMHEADPELVEIQVREKGSTT